VGIDPASLGAAGFIPTVIVPLLLWSHVLVLAVLLPLPARVVSSGRQRIARGGAACVVAGGGATERRYGVFRRSADGRPARPGASDPQPWPECFAPLCEPREAAAPAAS